MKKIKFLIFVISAIIVIAIIYFFIKPFNKLPQKDFSKVEKVELKLSQTDSLNQDTMLYLYIAKHKEGTLRIRNIMTDRKEISSRKFSHDEFIGMLNLLIPASETNDTVKANVKMFESDTVKFYIADNQEELIKLLNK